MARDVYVQAQHLLTDAIISSFLLTLRNVACCPAKLAFRESSAVAELLTATGTLFPAFLQT